MKRNLAEIRTWRRSCHYIVTYALMSNPPKNFSEAYEWLKREFNVKAIQGTFSHRQCLANLYYAARSGMELGKTKTK